jgi:ribosome-associated protein
MQSASRLRRTPESPAKAQAKVTRPATGAASSLAAELRQVTAILEDYKAQDIVVIPLAGQASFADYLVIASGTSTRHVSSMGQALQSKLGKKEFLGLEGLSDGEWVCADMGNIVIHIFIPEKRVLYNLEKLWSYAFPEPEDSVK